jgi:hypothetical protein
MKTPLFGLFLLFFSLSSAYAVPTDVIGHIQTLKGQVSIVRGAQLQPGTAGSVLHRGDLIRTAKPGAVSIVMTDDTTISLGPNSELSLQEYAFDPKDGHFSLVMKMAKGTFSYLSGLIAKLAPDSVKLLIPDATIAVRGTKLLVDVQQ